MELQLQEGILPLVLSLIGQNNPQTIVLKLSHFQMLAKKGVDNFPLDV